MGCPWTSLDVIALAMKYSGGLRQQDRGSRTWKACSSALVLRRSGGWVVVGGSLRPVGDIRESVPRRSNEQPAVSRAEGPPRTYKLTSPITNGWDRSTAVGAISHVVNVAMITGPGRWAWRRQRDQLHLAILLPVFSWHLSSISLDTALANPIQGCVQHFIGNNGKLDKPTLYWDVKRQF